MANDRLINSTQGDSIISELRTMNTNLADIKSAMAGSSNPVAAEKAVNFYDYDGTCRYSYTAAEFAELTTMPDNPTHDGLTSQGWNWSLSDAKTHVASYGKLNIGQMYVTSDGKTRLYIRLDEGRLKPYLGLTGNSSGTSVSIDWGDNSTAESVTLNTSTVYTPHEYASAGDYVILITVTTGSIKFNSTTNNGSNIFRTSTTPNSNYDRVYRTILTKIEIGSSVTSIGGSALQNYQKLTSVTIPSSITSIDSYAFSSCFSLTSVIMPSGITSISPYAFYNCSSLTSVIIPSSVTSISNYAFNSCRSLTSVIIPSGVTYIGEYAFQECFSLISVIIPSGVTRINTYAFHNCSSLTSVIIPSGVTYIDSYAFYSCFGLGFIKFNSSTPATASSNAFGIPTDCIIYVPTGSLSDYTSKSNYPSSSTYTYIEY